MHSNALTKYGESVALNEETNFISACNLSNYLGKINSTFLIFFVKKKKKRAKIIIKNSLTY